MGILHPKPHVSLLESLKQAISLNRNILSIRCNILPQKVRKLHFIGLKIKKITFKSENPKVQGKKQETTLLKTYLGNKIICDHKNIKR